MAEYCVLALDLATTTGWAIWKTGMKRPHVGALRLPANPQEVGRPIAALFTQLMDLDQTYGPITDLVFEAQHIAAKVNADTVYRLIGLGAHCEWIAHEWSQQPRRQKVRCFKCHIQSWRKHFIGQGTGLSTQAFKEAAIRKAEELGVITEVADAAEAFGILDYYLAQIAQADRSVVTPWRDNALFKAPGLDL
jgi:hypothetical protein